MKNLSSRFVFMVCIALALAVLTGCVCTVERGAAKNVSDTQEMILPEYVKYVESDAALSAAQRDDRKKLVESLKRLTAQLRKNLED